LNVRSIAIRTLDSELGGFDWKHVRSNIEELFAEVPEVNVLLFQQLRAMAEIE
jgi:hypothetical protein